MTRILGVDPGLKGALALWDTDLDALNIQDAPTAEVAVGKSKARTIMLDAEFARRFRVLAETADYVVIEQVGGITKQSASASFNFGRVTGLVYGFAAYAGLPVYEVPPAVWKVRARVRGGKDGSRARACQLFPRYAGLFSRVKDDGRAEAALIARSIIL